MVRHDQNLTFSYVDYTIVSCTLVTAQAHAVEHLGWLHLCLADLSEIKSSDLAIPDRQFSTHITQQDTRYLSSRPGRSVNKVMLQDKEYHKIERMLRLSINNMSYVVFFIVFLYIQTVKSVRGSAV